jgi:hypothetical protein
VVSGTVFSLSYDNPTELRIRGTVRRPDYRFVYDDVPPSGRPMLAHRQNTP